MSSTADFQRFAFRLREFMVASMEGRLADAVLDSQFDCLALELFGLQYSRNSSYQTLSTKRGRTSVDVTAWRDVPAVSTAAFKEFEFTCLPADQRTAVFHSSGTTGQTYSRHFHNAASLEIYETSLTAWFGVHLFPDLEQGAIGPTPGSRHWLLLLTPPPVEAPHSSLAHMFETVRLRWGSGDSVFVGQVARDGAWSLNMDLVLGTLALANATQEPLVILGTAFAYVQLLDHLQAIGKHFVLAPGSRVMETGGYKGRSRAVPKRELYTMITKHLDVPSTHVVSEYGMSELSSQAYDSKAGSARPRRQFAFPPWAKAQVVSPETGREVADGEIGLLRVFDLANACSVMALQTEDLAVRRGPGFELVGRAVRAEPRGCSLMAVE